MTLSSTVNRASYSGNGSTTAFAFSYLFYSNTDLTVILVVDSTGVETIKELTTHYSVTGAGVASGGTVTMSTAPASGETLVIIRQVPLTQGLDLVENDPFPSELVEQQFDNLTMAAQQINTEVTRSIKLSDGDTTDVDLTLPTPVALKTFRWNAGLTALEEADDPGVSATAAAVSAAAALVSENNAASSESTAVAYAVKVDGAASGSDHSSKAWAVGGTGITDTASKGASKEWASNPEDDTVAGAGTFSALHYSAKASGFATAASVSADASAASAATASAAAAGIFWKEPVVNRSTGNLTLSGEQTIDGILTSTSRILVMNQSSAAENGIYVTASGAWARAVPLDTWDEHVGAVVLVSQGTAYSDQAFMCTVDPGGTLGSTAITWAAFGAVAVNFKVDSFETSTDYTAGTTTTLVITTDAGSEENIRVSFDGVVQHHSTYTYTSGTRTITFDAAIPIGTAEVECQYGSSVGIGTPSDGTVSEAKIADNAVTLAKMASGTDGNIISFDSSGNPVAIATGTDGQVLTSAGAGAQPAFEDVAAGGKIVQVVNVQTGAVATGTTVMPFDDTIPQITEGDEYMTLAITPTSATNKLLIDVCTSIAPNANIISTVALFVGTTANALAAILGNYHGVNVGSIHIDNFSHYMTAGATTELTFRVRSGGHASNTTTFNGRAGGRYLGGVAASSITITEISA